MVPNETQANNPHDVRLGGGGAPRDPLIECLGPSALPCWSGERPTKGSEARDDIQPCQVLLPPPTAPPAVLYPLEIASQNGPSTADNCFFNRSGNPPLAPLTPKRDAAPLSSTTLPQSPPPSPSPPTHAHTAPAHARSGGHIAMRRIQTATIVMAHRVLTRKRHLQRVRSPARLR